MNDKVITTRVPPGTVAINVRACFQITRGPGWLLKVLVRLLHVEIIVHLSPAEVRFPIEGRTADRWQPSRN